MAATFFDLPSEVRRHVYSYVFAGAHSTFDFNNDTSRPSQSLTRRDSFTTSSNGHLSFLRASKQCYRDAVDSYHEARTVCIRNLSLDGLDNFHTLSHIHNKAQIMELDDFHINDLSVLPSFPRLRRLVLSGVRMWGGYMVVQRGQKALEAFDDGGVLECLFKHIRYSSLKIEERISKYFPTAHVVVNFNIGHQVMDKNMILGVQDWDWACSYDVKTNKLEKRIAHRLVLW